MEHGVNEELYSPTEEIGTPSVQRKVIIIITKVAHWLSNNIKIIDLGRS